MPPAKGPAPKRIPVRKVEGRKIVTRVIIVLLAFAVVSFAVQGGEYGTTDLLRTRAAVKRERAKVDSLERRVKLLEREKKAVESDPNVQERIAREEFGMVKGDRELLYRFVDSVPAAPAPDSVRRP